MTIVRWTGPKALAYVPDCGSSEEESPTVVGGRTMNDLDKVRAEVDARRRIGEPHHSTRYREAANRYLAAANYRELNLVPSSASESMAAMPGSAGHQARHTKDLVLVAVDESPASYTALDHAAVEAELRGCDLHLVHVQHTFATRNEARDRGAQLLEQMTERLHGCSPTLSVTGRLLSGTASAALLSEAKDATLVVVGHRHGVAGSAFGRTVGERVASHHAGPVLVVRIPGWLHGPDLASRPIIVGVDESTASRVAIKFALAEAKLRECDVVLIRARNGRMESGDHLESFGDVVVHHQVVTGDPASALITASRQAAAVVVGRSGHGGLTGGPVGSVTRAMIQHAECPVFLVG
jgi:nucleotide-binding universal stress UspA family protein